jgi:zinc transport system permease protein
MFVEILQYGFMQKAIVTGLVTAISCSLLGVFLVLRRYALIGDGIAHISFGGIAAGVFFGIIPFVSALFFAILGSIGILHLKNKAHLYGDTAIGIVSHASLGIGIFVVSIAQGFNVDLLSYLFGSILAISSTEVVVSITLALTIILIIIFFYHDLFYLTFDEESAKTSGVKVDFLNTLLILLTAITIVIAMRVVGLLLASSLIIMPASSALQLKLNFKKTLMCSALISMTSVLAGLLIASAYDFAVSGTIVLINTFVFIFLLLIKKLAVCNCSLTKIRFK